MALSIDQVCHQSGLGLCQAECTAQAGDAQAVHAASPSTPSALADDGRRRLARTASGFLWHVCKGDAVITVRDHKVQFDLLAESRFGRVYAQIFDLRVSNKAALIL